MSNNIPTEEDFRKAEEADAKRNRGLSDAAETIKREFKLRGVHQVFLFYSSSIDEFGAYVFYNDNKAVRSAGQNGLSDKIRHSIYKELERHGRGNRDEITLTVEFDSHENVVENYEGDYFLRLR